MSANNAGHRADCRPALNPFVAGAADRRGEGHHRAWWAPVGTPALALGIAALVLAIVLALLTR
ncbi:MAG TPA: hypothetical protein VIR30_09345 [Nocardioides sp.]